MQLIRDKQTPLAKLDLTELYRMAQQEGSVELGGIRSECAAEIKLRDCGDHYLCVRSRRFQTVEQNLSQCIADARIIRAALKGMGVVG